MRPVPRRSSLWLYTVLGMSLALNAAWLVSSLAGAEEARPAATAAITPSRSAAVAEGSALGRRPRTLLSSSSAPLEAPGDAQPEVTAAATLAEAGDLHVARARLSNTLPQSLAAHTGAHRDGVSAAYSRLLMWDLDLRRDLRAGDELALVYRFVPGGDVQIDGAHYESSRHGARLTAYRFQATGDRYPSYWTADGVEVARRLVDSPLAEYEQITSLLGDRPNHHGMDFKTPVGTPVRSPFEGTVRRVNWNWAANGNCLEIEYPGGVLAKFLHLSESAVAVGERVRAGQTIALTGNTGRSTGPHLHYQLNRGSQVLDPVDVHGVERRSLPSGDRATFEGVVRQLEALMAGTELAVSH